MTIADVTIEVQHQYDAVRRQCEDYLAPVDAAPSLVAAATPEKMAAELDMIDGPYPIEEVESLCVFRAIADQFPLIGRAVFHGAAIEYNGGGLLFTAPSGTGKSTHIALWRQAFGEDVRIVNGDKPVLWNKGGEVWVCSTPWAGKENWQRNCAVPLKALCLLERGKVDTIRPVDPSEMLNRLLAQIYLPADSQAAGATLELADALLTGVPVYLLSCTPTLKAAQVAHEALSKLC